MPSLQDLYLIVSVIGSKYAGDSISIKICDEHM